MKRSRKRRKGGASFKRRINAARTVVLKLLRSVSLTPTFREIAVDFLVAMALTALFQSTVPAPKSNGPQRTLVGERI